MTFHPSRLRSLADLPDFRGLIDVCHQFGVEITAFGSIVRRIALAEIEQHRLRTKNHPAHHEPPSLFDLSPFLSDIDLKHSGPSDLTAEIRREILRAVPFSEFFRWEIFSERDLKVFADDQAHLPLIPADKLTLSTIAGNGIQDPFDARRDLLEGQYRMFRSPYRNMSALVRECRDAEMLYVLSFMRIVFEDSRELDLFKQPGWNTASEICTTTRTSDLASSLQESSTLRARLLYRIHSLRAACPRADLWNSLQNEDPVGPLFPLLMTYFPFPPEDEMILPDFRQLLVTSCRLKGDNYRVSNSPYWVPDYPDYHSETNAPRTQWKTIQRSRKQIPMLSDHCLPELPSSHKIVACSPDLPYRTGKAPSAENDEFLHFQIPLYGNTARECDEAGDKNLAAFLVLSQGENSKQSIAFPIPSACWLKKSDAGLLLHLRINCGCLLEGIPGLIQSTSATVTTDHSLRVFVVREI